MTTHQGKVFSYPENFRALKILISARYGGHDVTLDESFKFGETNTTKAFLKKFPQGKVPCIELTSGQLMDESNSAAWFLSPDSMTGSGDKTVEASILRWISLADLEVTPAACNWVYPLVGIMETSPAMDRGREDTIKLLTWLNTELRLKTWLVGERITLADICLMSSLLLVFTHKEAMDEKLKDELPHVTRWYNTVVNQKLVKAVLDTVNLEITHRKGYEKGKSGMFLCCAVNLIGSKTFMFNFVLYFYNLIYTFLDSCFYFTLFQLFQDPPA